MAFTDFTERAWGGGGGGKGIFIYNDTQFAGLMRNNNRVLETTQHKLPMDLTHKLCKTDMINMNDIQLLNTSESFAHDFWCHVEYKLFFTAMAVEW